MLGGGGTQLKKPSGSSGVGWWGLSQSTIGLLFGTKAVLRMLGCTRSITGSIGMTEKLWAPCSILNGFAKNAQVIILHGWSIKALIGPLAVEWVFHFTTHKLGLYQKSQRGFFYYYLKADTPGVIRTRDSHFKRTLNLYVRRFEFIRKISKIDVHAE